ncbi:UNVERIFIED_CONTAM: Retrovirus-related Pol polyprotein from transposon gypsy [Sesamum radiatum]|uniref:Retrovirus-related Pol polyprotein from transposon gypsy n=1 Tax=Sesamum radiatum TaxID=300843 RepID=A0AAW2JN99_SESRA
MTDLHGISPDVITYTLSVNPNAKPIKQKKKRMFEVERSQAIKAEVDKLLKAKYIRTVQYPEWLANVMLVPKPNGKWRLEDQEKASFEQIKIGQNMEVYIDDMLVKSAKEQDHIEDLEEYFQILTTFGMKLNLAKCTFRVRGGKFLGYMISERGIEANLEKINAIMDMSPPKSIREVQKLVGRLAALNKFISRSADKGLPFFKILSGVAKFEWTKTSQEAFDELKKYLVSPPLLTKPETGETLYLYLAFFENVVSLLLVRQENREHQLVLASPKLSGRMVKWVVELSEYDIEFHSGPTIKAQVLADFVVELAYDEVSISTPTWSLYVDGSSTSTGSGAGVVLESP